MRTTSRAVVVFGRDPRAGRGKSRLAAGLGPARTAALARAFFEDALRLAESSSATVVLALEDGGGFPSQHRVVVQRGAGLGERMEHALAVALEHAERAVLIGTDGPGLPRAVLEEAFDLLDAHDVVFTPVPDGGFLLVGTKRSPVDLFAGASFGAADTLVGCEALAIAAGHRVARTAPWFDVDEPDDLATLRAALDDPAVEADATRAALGAESWLARA